MPLSPFLIRGVVEGFYGLFYTAPERNDLIRFLGKHGYNYYIYGPKNDRQHRARWYEPYSDEVMAQFAETVQIARESGITFCYALSPISATTANDVDAITHKLYAFYQRGVRSFSLFLDDIAGPENDGKNSPAYATFIELHLQIANRVYAWLHDLDPVCTLSFCPVEYHGSAPFGPYLHALGQRLHPAIDLFYTGPEVCPRTIEASDVQAFAAVAGRRPLMWDNYPVNDLGMRREMHIGPLQGRNGALSDVTRGFIVNLMSQAEASKVALLTVAEYLQQPHTYEPWAAWERALEFVGGSAHAALRCFAENSLYSCLNNNDAPKLAVLTNVAVAALQGGEWPSVCSALHHLNDYLHTIDEACYVLKHHNVNLRLRENLIPWIEALEDWVWMGKRAVQVLNALELGTDHQQALHAMAESLELIRAHHKRIAGQALLPLADYVLAQVERHHLRASFVVEQHNDQPPVAPRIPQFAGFSG